MLKSVKEYMGIGVEVYPIISLLVFFLFFVLLFWWVFTYKKESIKQLRDLPFDNDSENNIVS